MASLRSAAVTIDTTTLALCPIFFFFYIYIQWLPSDMTVLFQLFYNPLTYSKKTKVRTNYLT